MMFNVEYIKEGGMWIIFFTCFLLVCIITDFIAASEFRCHINDTVPNGQWSQWPTRQQVTQRSSRQLDNCARNWTWAQDNLAIIKLSRPQLNLAFQIFSNSADNLRHTRSVAYSVELVLLNKHPISDIWPITRVELGNGLFRAEVSGGPRWLRTDCVLVPSWL